MAFFYVDLDKCKQDGICAAECPRRVIAVGEDGTPYIPPEKEPYCMQCGHCVAVCPYGAVSVAGSALQDCPEIDPGLNLSWEQTEQFLRSRRSIRVYKDKPVEREVMQKLIDTARYAPTASNGQTLQWQVTNDRKRLDYYSEKTIDWMREVIRDEPDSPFAKYCRPVVAGWEAGYDGILRNAPCLVIASAPGANAHGLVDLSIALSYFEFAALPLGVGTCWAGLLRAAMQANPQLVEEIGLPEGHTWFYPLMVGYPKFKYHRLPQRREAVITWK